MLHIFENNLYFMTQNDTLALKGKIELFYLPFYYKIKIIYFG